MAPRACRRRSCSCPTPACCRGRRVRGSSPCRALVHHPARLSTSSGRQQATPTLRHCPMPRLASSSPSARDIPEKQCWYELIKDGLAGHLVEIANPDGTSVRRMESAQAAAVSPRETKEEEHKAAPLLDWALAPAKPERSRRRLAPSRLTLGPDGISQERADEQPPLGPRALSQGGRYARGLLVHALLQHLPE